MFSIETERLRLRPFEDSDFDFLVTLNADTDVARFIGHGRPRTREESRDFLDHILSGYASHERGHLLVCDKASGQPVGRCGLTLLEAEADPAPGETVRWYWFPGSAPAGMPIVNETELGYVFGKAHWGRGYATECAAAVRDYAFAELGLPSIVSAIAADNLASKNVARKVGLVHEGERLAFGAVYECHRLRATRWRQMKTEG